MSKNTGGSSYDKKLWGGRFESGPTGDVIQFSTSIGIDWRLWEADIDGSVAHAKMLGKQGILSQADADEIVRGLEIVRTQIRLGPNPIWWRKADLVVPIEVFR